MISKIAIIGGDLRIVKLAQMLSEEGAEVFTYGLEEADIEDVTICKSIEELFSKSENILTSIPFTSNGITINAPFSKEEIKIEDIINYLDNKTLIAGGIRDNIYELLQNKKVNVIDLLKREELSVLNAVATSEGAIKIAIEETQKTLHGSNILVMGYGRIGKVLANMLKGIGANVYCEARKNSDLAWIKAYGYNPIHISNLTENLQNFDIIINTIPHIVLDKSNLDRVKKEALIIDLASNPGGVDREVIKKMNIKYIWALSLPGKVAPVTSAEYIKQTLYNIFYEIGRI